MHLVRSLASFSVVSVGLLAACAATTDDGVELPPPDATISSQAAPVATVPGDPMGVVIRKLPNGLTVMLSPNSEEPRINAWITTRAGSAKDPSDATGMAHYLEHMLFKGTTRLGTLDWEKEKPHLDRITALYEELFHATDPAERARIYAAIDAEGVAAAQYEVPNEIDQLYSAMGFSGVNAFTSNDQTSYVCELPANRLEHWAMLESDRFSDAVFRLFQTELEAVYEEMNTALDSAQRAMFQAGMLAMFPDHPYGLQPTLGTVEHLKNPSLRKMYAFLEKWYVPENMCIALAGDFDPAEALEIIERHFGKWEARAVAPDPVFPIEKPQGRKFVEVVHKGDEMVALSFLTVPEGHADYDALVLCDMMLDNQQTGLINVNLSQAQAVREAGSGPMFLAEAGVQNLRAVPKPGQTLEECEALLLEQIRLLKEGAFSEDDLDAVLTDFEVGEKRGLESNRTRVSQMTSAFVNQRPWQETVESLDRLRRVTKDQVVAAANAYFGDDFTVVYRRDGQPELPDVTKPSFTPIEIKGDVHTPFFESILSTPADPIEPVFAVAGKDYQVRDYDWGRLYYGHNPVNDVFDLEVHFAVGSDHDHRLQLAYPLIGLAGAGDLDPIAYKRRLYALGSEVGGGASEQETVFSASGLDAHFAETLDLMNAHFRTPTGLGQQDVAKFVQRVLGMRMMQKNAPQALNGALQMFALRGEQSPFLTGPTNAELQALQAADVIAAARDVWKYKRTVVYVGQLPLDDVAAAFAQPAGAQPLIDAPAYVPEEYVRPEKSRVLFLQQKGAQAQVGVFGPDVVFEPKQFPQARVYNEMMSGGMSGVVFQEVREARSLAYSVWTNYGTGSRAGDRNVMRAGMSNQQDKAVEAVDVLLGLIRAFPGSETRLAQVQSAIDQSYRTNRLGFRGMPGAALTWDRWGIGSDPREYNWKTAVSMDLGAVQAFAKRFSALPLTITIVGDKEKVDLSALARFGEVREVTKDELFNF